MVGNFELLGGINYYSERGKQSFLKSLKCVFPENTLFFNQASSALVCSHNKSYLLAGLSRGGGKSLRYG